MRGTSITQELRAYFEATIFSLGKYIDIADAASITCRAKLDLALHKATVSSPLSQSRASFPGDLITTLQTMDYAYSGGGDSLNYSNDLTVNKNIKDRYLAGSGGPIKTPVCSTLSTYQSLLEKTKINPHGINE